MKHTKTNEIIAQVLTVMGLILIGYQLHQSNEHKKWENYNSMNSRYFEWYFKMPDSLKEDIVYCKAFNSHDQKTMNWVRAYFNLYSEEYWLYKKNLIPKEMWEKRIRNGVDVNLTNYPILINGYYYWREQGSFKHPKGFIEIVDKKISNLLNNSKVVKCKNIL